MRVSAPFLVVLAGFGFATTVPAPVLAWQTHLAATNGEAFALAVAFGPNGSVVAGGIADLGGDLGYATVVKLASDGTLVWRRTIDPVGSQTRSVAVDAAGDVLVGGLAGGLDESIQGHFTAVKLAGATGAELWRHEPVDAFEGSMVVDRDGNALASIVIQVNPGTGDEDFRTICRKLSGSDGAVVWQNDDCARGGAVDAHGDLYVANPFVGRISGRDGHEIWRVDPAVAGGGGPLAVDSAGDVVLAQGVELVKLSGSDGSLMWRQRFRGIGEQLGIRHLAIDPRDDVVAGGTTAYVDNKGSDILVAKFKGRDGRRRWRRRVDTRNRVLGYSYDRETGVGVDASGDVILTGELQGIYAENAILVMKLKSKNGRPLWTRHPEGTGGRCWDVAVGPLGASAIAGGIGPVPEAVGAGAFFVTRLDAAGEGTTPILVQ